MAYTDIGLATAEHEAPLNRILRRIHVATTGMTEIAAKLRQHADIVHGGLGESAEVERPRPCRSGLLGQIEDALDDLDRAHSMVAEQSGRNSTLA